MKSPLQSSSINSDSITNPQMPWHGFPPVFFLDAAIFEMNQVEIPSVSIIFSPDIVEATRNYRLIAMQYFENFHGLLPFISKKLFYEQLMNTSQQPQTDLILLLLCMKLIVWLPSESLDESRPKTPDYLAVKRLLVEADVAGTMTLQILQAMIIISIYELGHAIYPPAYLSIGACARYGLALGINAQKESIVIDSSSTILEQEERRRAWWAIVVLDRFENFHNQF